MKYEIFYLKSTTLQLASLAAIRPYSMASDINLNVGMKFETIYRNMDNQPLLANVHIH